uniref:Uncharacterized protein n=1 Tax=Ciona savignyi TaxID=51511 RepID=H2YWI9_CIOSA
MTSNFRRHQPYFKKYRENSDDVHPQHRPQDDNGTSPRRFLSRSPVRRPPSGNNLSGSHRSPEKSVAETAWKRGKNDISPIRWSPVDYGSKDKWPEKSGRIAERIVDNTNFPSEIDHRVLNHSNPGDMCRTDEQTEVTPVANTVKDSMELSKKMWAQEAENVFKSDCMTISEVTQLLINEEPALEPRILPVMERCLQRLLSSHLKHLHLVRATTK